MRSRFLPARSGRVLHASELTATRQWLPVLRLEKPRSCQLRDSHCAPSIYRLEPSPAKQSLIDPYGNIVGNRCRSPHYVTFAKLEQSSDGELWDHDLRRRLAAKPVVGIDRITCAFRRGCL